MTLVSDEIGLNTKRGRKRSSIDEIKCGCKKDGFRSKKCLCVSKGNKCGLDCTCDTSKCTNKPLGYGEDSNSSAGESDVSFFITW